VHPDDTSRHHVQVAYLESITDPIGGVQSRDYRVEGCRVTAFAKGPTVIGYSLDLTPRCNFDLGAYLGNGYPSTKGLTIRKFASGLFGPSLLVRSSCIYLCGNAADPTVEFEFEGPHAVNYVNVVLTVVLADEGSIAAANRWDTYMRKRENENYIVDARFNRDQKYATEAIRDLRMSLLPECQSDSPDSNRMPPTTEEAAIHETPTVLPTVK
jgi:hypothetical protein